MALLIVFDISSFLVDQVVVELSVPGATGVFTAPEGGGRAARGRNRDTLVLVSCSSPPPPLPQAPLAAGESGPGHTRVLAFEEDARVCSMSIFFTVFLLLLLTVPLLLLLLLIL